jgi:hypothetical protein
MSPSSVKQAHNTFHSLSIMNFLLPAFKMVSVVFAASAVVTGIQALVDPIGSSRFFGLPVTIPTVKDADQSQSTTTSYVSLMGVRQLATGITLLTFAYQRKWTEMATILTILGFVVAGTDGFYLSRSGARNLGIFHAIPGALIALIAAAVVLTDA